MVTDTNLATFTALLTDRFVNPDVTFSVERGARYGRIVRTFHGDQRSAYGFIDLTTGDLLKAASWKTPAKGRRGNIFAADPLAGCTPYGMVYYK